MFLGEPFRTTLQNCPSTSSAHHFVVIASQREERRYTVGALKVRAIINQDIDRPIGLAEFAVFDHQFDITDPEHVSIKL